MSESRSSLSSSVKLENDEISAFVSGVIYLLANETPFSVSENIYAYLYLTHYPVLLLKFI